jgi:hemoglobin/transferrin/lactoferrin receptor protein
MNGWGILGGTYRHVGDLRAGGSVGVQSPTGWKEMDGNIALSYRFAPNQTFVCAYQGVRQQDVPRYDMYPGGRYATGKESSGAYQIYLFTPQNRDLLYLDYSVRSVNDYIDVLHTTVSFHRQKEGREIQKEDDSILRTEEDDTKTLGAHLQLVSSFKMKHQLIYGLEIYRDKVGSERIDTDLETGNAEIRKGRYPDGSSFESVAFYLRDEITLRSNLIVSLGGRYNRFRLQADLDDTTFGSIDAVTHAFTGSCGVVYGLTENMNITCGLAQAFRAPNLDDETAFGDFHSGIEVPNPGLEPEQSITSEIGLKVRYSTWSGALTAYMTNLHNLIDRERSTYQGSSTLDGQYVWKKTNMNRARIQGVEANGEWSFLSEWSLYGNAAWVSGKDLSGDEPLRRIPPVMGLLGAEWKSSRGNLWAEGFIRCAGKQDKLSSEDKADVRIPPGGTPGWMTCNFRAGYRFSKFVHLIFGLENIFDEAYREHGSGLYGPGRNFIIHSEITI